MNIPFFTNASDPKTIYVLNQFKLFTSLDITFDIRVNSAPAAQEPCIIYTEDPGKIRDDMRGIICHHAPQKHTEIAQTVEAAWKNISFFFYKDLGMGDVPVAVTTAQTHIRFDIISQIFRQLTCAHETELEAAGKFPFSNLSAITSRGDAFDTPNVNRLFMLLEEMISEIFNAPKRKNTRYPKDAKFCIALTHDVDSPAKGIPERIKHGIHGIRRMVRCAASGEYGRIPVEGIETFKKIFRRTCYNKFEHIARIESEKHVRSSFNIYVRCRDNNHTFTELTHNPHYDILSDMNMREQLRALSAQGFEVGLHGSYCLHHDRSPLGKEKLALEGALAHPIVGGRQHFLNYSAARTPALFAAAGFSYDTTVGFRDRNAFRAGAALPYFLYDTKRDMPLNVLEIPLVIMDGVLFDRLNHTPESAWTTIETLLTRIKDARGACSVVWHQRVFDNPDYPHWDTLYLRLIDWVSAHDGICMTPGELDNFWRTKK